MSNRDKIHIQRNPVEQFLMNVKEYLKARKKLLFMIMAFVGVIAVVGIAVLVYVDQRIRQEKQQLEVLMDQYATALQQGDVAVRDEIIGKVSALDRKARFGFADRYAPYILGAMYYTDEKYQESHDAYIAYSGKSKEPVLYALAMLKAAIALEETGDLSGALALLEKLGDDDRSLYVEDQLLYHRARITQRKGDAAKALDLYNKVISEHPQSAFSRMARTRILQLEKK